MKDDLQKNGNEGQKSMIIDTNVSLFVTCCIDK